MRTIIGVRKNASGTTIATRRIGFTLIELLVVVAIISVLSGILLPVFITARDRARKRNTEQVAVLPNQSRSGTQRQKLPGGPAPIIDALKLDMTLSPSYHRIGMDVFTRYRVDCTGHVNFRHPGGTAERRVLLVVPFPQDIVDARDVQLQVQRTSTRVAPPNRNNPLLDVVYDKSGIYATCLLNRGEILAADLTFTAFGREQFDYALPPARELRSVDMALNLSGTEARTIPDEALQPSVASPNQLRWAFKNLVSDRQITVLIPGAQAPLARVLLLSRLVAVAVLLFGAGFWFLSEQSSPGQLDRFRWGHFLLLALTFSLFFVIFAVLEFHGRLTTSLSMAVSGLFSLPLLVLHVARVLNLRFAVTRVLPLAILTLGLVVNGVYGGAFRDYGFISATIFIIGYVTVAYESWAAGRERHLQNQESVYSARRRELVEKVTYGIGEHMAALDGAEALSTEYSRPGQREELLMAQARLQSAKEPVGALRKEYDELKKRLGYLPAQPGWESDSYRTLERDANSFQERLEPQLAHLQAELAHYRDEVKALAAPVSDDEKHCMACGRTVPGAPFCQNCGVAQPLIVNCTGCGERVVIPLHVLAENSSVKLLHCPRCGTSYRSYQIHYRQREKALTRLLKQQEPNDTWGLYGRHRLFSMRVPSRSISSTETEPCQHSKHVAFCIRPIWETSYTRLSPCGKIALCN
jgi:prepilin-type N-terminal cleavage/methylation domain-containing protein